MAQSSSATICTSSSSPGERLWVSVAAEAPYMSGTPVSLRSRYGPRVWRDVTMCSGDDMAHKLEHVFRAQHDGGCAIHIERKRDGCQLEHRLPFGDAPVEVVDLDEQVQPQVGLFVLGCDPRARVEMKADLAHQQLQRGRRRDAHRRDEQQRYLAHLDAHAEQPLSRLEVVDACRVAADRRLGRRAGRHG
eukprot:scaffold9726_cov119-Isochrysis_galbana.AAC.31